MSAIGGPGGVDGPSGPSGPSAPGGPGDVENVGEPAAAGAINDVQIASPVSADIATSDIDALATEVAAGRLTPQEAINRLLDATASAGLEPQTAPSCAPCSTISSPVIPTSAA